jgi:protein phosphatase
VKAIESANYSIYATAQRIPKYRDMGTTIVAMHFVGTRVYIGWVGDSRVYRIRAGKIAQISEDHSLANEYVRMNILRKEDIRTFPYKNVIVRALGLAGEVEVDTLYRTSKEGDVYLCCSDGLTDLIEDADILSLINGKNGDLAAAADALVDAANDEGGVDNITVLLVRVGSKG